MDIRMVQCFFIHRVITVIYMSNKLNKLGVTNQRRRLNHLDADMKHKYPRGAKVGWIVAFLSCETYSNHACVDLIDPLHVAWVHDHMAVRDQIKLTDVNPMHAHKLIQPHGSSRRDDDSERSRGRGKMRMGRNILCDGWAARVRYVLHITCDGTKYTSPPKKKIHHLTWPVGGRLFFC
jgi:hypothetical protein